MLTSDDKSKPHESGRDGRGELMSVPRPNAPARLRSLVISAAVVISAVAACYSGPSIDQAYYGEGSITGDGGGSEASATTCTPDIASIQKTIFGPSCTQSGCHNAVEKAAGLNLAGTNIEAQLIGQSSTCGDTLLVVPGSPDTSNLYQKVTATKPPCGDVMPLGFPALSQANKDCIKQWIAGLVPGAFDAGADAAGCGDTQTSITNCGSCGHACATGATCVSGACQCPSGASTLCGASATSAGTCVNAQNDVKNCGTCGTACPPAADATKKYCVLGACSANCSQFVCPDGACVDNQTDITHCGTTCVACPSGQACVAGTCACPSGTIPCGGTCVSNNTTTNCGTCGKTCAPGQACNAGVCACGSASVAFATVQTIFTNNCATNGCHKVGANGQLPMGVQNLDLSVGKSYGNIVNVDAAECTADARVRVKPTDPVNSYLMQKLQGTMLCGTPSTKMPKSGLPTADITTVGNWICAGAPSN